MPGLQRFLKLFTVIVIVLSFTFAGSGCRVLKRDKQSMAEKKQAKESKQASAEYEKAVKKHHKRQSKEAKKMMKKTRKKAAKFNKPKERKGLFKKKCY